MIVNNAITVSLSAGSGETAPLWEYLAVSGAIAIAATLAHVYFHTKPTTTAEEPLAVAMASPAHEPTTTVEHC